MSEMRELRERISLLYTPLTNHDLHRFGIDQSNIITYSDLESIRDIAEFLPHNKSYKIVLIEYEPNVGHWVLILRHNDTLEYFNSLGLLPSKNDFVNDDLLNEELNQEELFLNRLFKKEMSENDFKDLIYNKKMFQNRNSDVMTCGRHCVVRLLCLLQEDMDLEEYITFMSIVKKESNMSYDQIVCQLTR
jgi:hypothetical protein